jgi:hypothetical protein
MVPDDHKCGLALVTGLLTIACCGCGSTHDPSGAGNKAKWDPGCNEGQIAFPETLVCNLELMSDRVHKTGALEFMVTIPGAKSTKHLCLSYMQDRPYRWLILEPMDGSGSEIRHMERLPGETQYAGNPVTVVLPDGGRLSLYGILFPGMLEVRPAGRYRARIEIPHVRSEDTRRWGWPVSDDAYWRGVIRSDWREFEIE